MSNQRIMYVCGLCVDENPEGCGHFDPKDLAVMPDGQWLCENCFDEERYSLNADDEYPPLFCDMPRPPRYAPEESA